MIQNFIGQRTTETYSTTKPNALVDIVPAGVVVPLDAVQKGSSADHQRAFAVRREEEDIASSSAVSDTPQKGSGRVVVASEPKD